MQNGQLIISAMPSVAAYTRASLQRRHRNDLFISSAVAYILFIAIGVLVYTWAKPVFDTKSCRLIIDFATIPEIVLFHLPETIFRIFDFLHGEILFLAFITIGSASYFPGVICFTLLLLRGLRVGLAFSRAALLYSTAVWSPLMCFCFLAKEAVFSAVLIYAVAQSVHLSYRLRIAVGRNFADSYSILASLFICFALCVLALICTTILFSFIL